MSRPMSNGLNMTSKLQPISMLGSDVGFTQIGNSDA